MATLIYRGKSHLVARFSSARFCRHIYSTTGEWPAELTNAVRLSVEKYWLDECSYSPPTTVEHSADKMYVLSMFPYPSGRLHMGHVRVYSIGDTIARYHRLCGKQVVQPMGWDAFGLPAENAAVQHGVDPVTWTRENVRHMRQQLRRLVLSVDWSRQVDTSSPYYYRWTQWLFLQLLRANLVYQRYARVNWDPVDGTVLADEQVDARGRSWRSGARVEQRMLRQWFVRTTRYSEQLYAGLDSDCLVDWHDIIQLQKHWIGVCNGWRLDLQVCDGAGVRLDIPLSAWLPDLLQLSAVIGVAIRSDHCLAERLRLSSTTLCNRLSVCIPAGASGSTYRLVPLLLSDDSQLFAEGQDSALLTSEHRELVDQLIAGGSGAEEDAGTALVDTGETLSRREDDFSSVSIEQLAVLLEASRASSRLQDWPVSRQRYWGTPIPIVHCTICGAVAVPESQLPVQLPAIDQLKHSCRSAEPRLKRFQLTDAGDWLNTPCPRCGKPGRRETDTMDTFFDSSWYYLRYLDPDNSEAPFSRAAADAFMPVDTYIGGKEHAILHLYFARFIGYFLHSIGMLRSPEPFKRLLTQGQVMGQSFRSKLSGVYLPRDQVDLSGDTPVVAGTDECVTVQWEKMSKSKLNGVEPDSVLDVYGADTTRLFILSGVTPRSPRNWSEEQFPLLLSWQQKLWDLMSVFVRDSHHQRRQQQGDEVPAEKLELLEERLREQRNTAVRCVSISMISAFNISVALTRLQFLSKQLTSVPEDMRYASGEFQRALGDMIIMLSTVMPCLTAEMWSAFVRTADRNKCSYNWDGLVHQQSWPELDKDGKVFMQIQVNRNPVELVITREKLESLSEEDLVHLATQLPEVQQQLQHVDKSHVQLQRPFGGVVKLWGPTVQGFVIEKKKNKLRLRK